MLKQIVCLFFLTLSINVFSLESSSVVNKFTCSNFDNNKLADFIINLSNIENNLLNGSNEIIQKFIRPVNGIILRKYNPTAVNNKTEGIDFAAKPGTPVKSTATGVVALISEPVGGLGKIILIIPRNNFTYYYNEYERLKMKEFIETIVKQLVDKPNDVNVNPVESDDTITYELTVGDGDYGKVIGKRGRNVSAIRTILFAINAKEGGKRARLELMDDGD